MALVHERQATYLAHILRADKDDPIRFVMFNDFLQHTLFYSVSHDKKSRPTPKWIDAVSIHCTKAFFKKHPKLSSKPASMQDLHDIAQDRTAFAALAHSLVIQAQRNQKRIGLPEPPDTAI